jgi:arylsulfatase A-like enzyme
MAQDDNGTRGRGKPSVAWRKALEGSALSKAFGNGLSRRDALIASAAGIALGAPVAVRASATAAAEADAPYQGFKGIVGRTFLESKPWWPPEKRAPERAPNVIVILCDDLGYADVGCFGSEISTPNIDKLAAEGIRFANYHSEPTCSPTRAALLTGINPHAVGFGIPAVPGGADPGFPGYSWQLPDDTATMPELFRDNGYATLAVGKWHLCRQFDTHEFSDSSSWPTKRGFDQYYGHWGDPNAWLPDEIWSDNHIVDTESYPEGYFYPDDITSRAVSMIRSVRQSDPDKPYLLYLAYSSPHAPMNAKPNDIAKYKGKFDKGWDSVRQERFERQKKMGIVDPKVRLPAPNSELGLEAPPWSGLSPKEKELASRYMELNAAVIDNIDTNIGRLRAAIEQMDEWENTIVIFTSDNGANREGFRHGSTQYGQLIFHVMQGEQRGGFGTAGGSDLDFDYENLKKGLIGGPQTLSDYPQAWAMASGTPWRLYKASTFCGGHQVPFIFSWPKLVQRGGTIRSQYSHVTDILPSMLDLVGLTHPTERAGLKLKTMTGSSFAHFITKANASSLHTEQYTESSGSRRYYRDGWAIVTNHRPMTKEDDAEWQLFDLKNDPTEIDNLAARYPERVKLMSAAWERAAWKNQVFPLSEGSGVIFLSHAPYEERWAKPLTLYQGAPSVASARARWLMEGRSFAVRVRSKFTSGDEGTLFKHGGQGGGYGLYVEDGKLLFVLNGYGRMTEVSAGPVPIGSHEILVILKAPGGYRWDLDIQIDGNSVATRSGLPMLMSYAPIGGIDVGIDRRCPVSWRLYEQHGAFRYTGAIDWVRYEPGAWAPEMDPALADQMRSRARQGMPITL